MSNTYRDFELVSMTTDWKKFWTYWYKSKFSVDKGAMSVGPIRTLRIDVDEKKNDLLSLEIYYKYRHIFMEKDK